MLETIQILSKKRMEAIVNTHFPAHALKIANKALMLSYNRTCKFVAVEHIVTEQNMRKAFQVEIKIVNFSYLNGENHKSVIP